MIPPTIVEHHGLLVLRDDMIEGGSKVRVAPALLGESDEWVFAGPAQGLAQVALAIACEQTGKRGVFFTAARKEPHPLTRLAMSHGLRVVFVPLGRISNVQHKARAYCELTGARFIELGLKLPGMEDALYELALSLPVTPMEVWVACGSGTLTRALARAWPAAEVNSVQVGMTPHLGDDLPNIRRWKAPEQFQEPASGPLPPFPSVRTYDAKIWRFVVKHARMTTDTLVWNVARDP